MLQWYRQGERRVEGRTGERRGIRCPLETGSDETFDPLKNSGIPRRETCQLSRYFIFTRDRRSIVANVIRATFGASFRYGDSSLVPGGNYLDVVDVERRETRGD